MEPRLKKERLLLLPQQVARLSLEFDRGLIECVCLFLSVDVCLFCDMGVHCKLVAEKFLLHGIQFAQPQTLPSLQWFFAETFPLRGGCSGVLLIFCLTKVWSKFPGFWGSYSVMLVQKLWGIIIIITIVAHRLSCPCTKALNPGCNARNLLQPSCGFDLLWFERKIYSASIITLIDVEDGGRWMGAVFGWKQAAHSCNSWQSKPWKAQWMCHVSKLWCFIL